jgi:hypothetical protein
VNELYLELLRIRGELSRCFRASRRPSMKACALERGGGYAVNQKALCACHRRAQGIGGTSRRCRCRPSPYLNNLIEQDHRFIKKRIAASLWFRSAEGAVRTIQGYEAMHLIRKEQIRWLAKGDAVGQRQFIHSLFGIAA